MNWLSPGLAVAVSPGLGYLLAYAYEAGYASYFHLPRELIALNLTFVLVVAAALLAVVLPLVAVAIFVMQVLPPGLVPLSYRPALYTTGAAVVVGVVFALLDVGYVGWIILIAIIIVSLALAYGLPLVEKGTGSTYRSRLEVAQRSAKENMQQHDSLMDRVAYSGVTALGALCVYAVLVAYLLGAHTAKTQQTFQVVQGTEPPRVALRIYGDLVVIKSVDPKTHHLGREIELTKLGEGSPLVLIPRHLGRLTAPKTQHSLRSAARRADVLLGDVPTSGVGG